LTFVVTDNRIKCRYMDCEVYPVDCFCEGENILAHPDECVDYGVCEPECRAAAIFPDTRLGLESWLELNADYARVWPNSTVKREPSTEAMESLSSFRLTVNGPPWFLSADCRRVSHDEFRGG
jgi:ferredoxin